MVDFITGKGWVHVPSNQAYWMEHKKMSRKCLQNYNRGMNCKRGVGCGWKGPAPASQITIKEDVCPGCGAVGELADAHVASPVYPKKRGRKTKGVMSKKSLRMAKRQYNKQFGSCSPKCLYSLSSKCDCSCGGASHGVAIQPRLF